MTTETNRKTRTKAPALPPLCQLDGLNCSYKDCINISPPTKAESLIVKKALAGSYKGPSKRSRTAAHSK